MYVSSKERNQTLILTMFDINKKEHQLIIEYPYTNAHKILLDIFDEGVSDTIIKT